MKIRSLSLSLLLVFLLTTVITANSNWPPDPIKALSLLQEGNERFIQGVMMRSDLLQQKETTATQGQSPFAVIVSCSDSRVPPELIFDTGIGELFVIRTAGHVLEAAAIGSIEYAVKYLGCRLIVILGHTECGAVGAALANGNASPNLSALIAAIAPAVDYTRQLDLDSEELASIAENKHMQFTRDYLLAESQIISDLIVDQSIEIHLGKYDMLTGIVNWH